MRQIDTLISSSSAPSMISRGSKTMHRTTHSVINVRPDYRTPFQPIKPVLRNSFADMNGKSRPDVSQGQSNHFCASLYGLTVRVARLGGGGEVVYCKDEAL